MNVLRIRNEMRNGKTIFDLLVLVGGNSGVEGHPQGQVEDGFSIAHFIAYPEHIQVRSPPLSSTQDPGKMGEYPRRNVPNPPRSNRWFSTRGHR